MKDLTKEPPRSPNEILGGFKILPRMIDKCRAVINNVQGEYKFNCPLDKRFFEFKKIDAEKFKNFVAENHTDEEILEWVNTHGENKTEEEIKEWADTVDKTDYATNPEKMVWFIPDCKELGLDPFKTSLHEYLEADDKATFASL